MLTRQIGLVVVGDEILSGKREDKHFASVVRLLANRGLTLSWARYVGDDRAALTRVFRDTLASHDVVLSCGGIGATPDDHTRQAVAAALNVEVALHSEASALIAERCADMAREGRGSADMSTAENLQRLRMGEFPVGSRIIPNPFNRIPGFSVHDHWFVPGFPVMAWPMIEWVLDEHYARLFGGMQLIERSMIVYDQAESALAPLMEAIEREFEGVRSFSLPSIGDGSDGRPARRHVELGVKGNGARTEAAFLQLRAAVLTLGAEIDSSPR